MAQIVGLVIFFALVGAAAFFGATFQPGDWYQTLNKPSWTPPNWLFGPVWTVLYIMIAIAGWRVWKTQGASPLLAIWFIGLVLNGLWSWLMFGENQIGWALVDIVALLTMIFAFIVLAWQPDRIAALLFIPYAVWVSYATALNFAIWRLNG